MYGPGFAPTPPPRRQHPAAVVAVRVTFVVITLASLGFAGWVAMLRIAVLRRRTLDWWLFGLSLALPMTAVVVIGTGETEEPRTVDVVLILVVLATAAVIVAYYLFAEIRHAGAGRRLAAGPFGTTASGPGQYGYGYPPYATTVPMGHPGSPVPPQQPPAGPYAPPVPPPAVPPRPAGAPRQSGHTPPRIDQVRAELDELSDILRKGQEDR